jgi:antirestriction protein ArdC
MARTKRAPQTDEEKAERRRRDLERFEQATRELLTSEGWSRWLRTRARFRTYSVGNQLLISLQTGGQATQVAGFRAWLALGRAVRKGEKAIGIWAPMPVKKEAKETADGEEETRMLFRVVSVFDVGQTDPVPGADPAPLQPPSAPIAGDSHAHLLAPLEAFGTELGVSVSFEEIPGGAGGFWDSKGARIVVDAGQPANARVRTLIHELAHAAGGVDYTAYSRPEAEVIVECVSFVVASAVGLDTGGESVPYVAGWGEDDDMAAIRPRADLIDGLAARVEQAITAEAEPRATA